MKKNVAGQKVGAQMLTAADHTAFAGAVTVYVCGDAGAQNVGSVGAGACVHEGNGYHTYAPDQAETNYDLVAFTFIGAGAIPATVQCYTTGDITAIKAVTDKLSPAASTLVTGTVSTAVFAATTTQFEAADIVEATADHYNGRLITWTSGALINQQTDIADYSLVAGKGHFTMTATTEAPAHGDTFVIQ